MSERCAETEHDPRFAQGPAALQRRMVIAVGDAAIDVVDGDRDEKRASEYRGNGCGKYHGALRKGSLHLCDQLIPPSRAPSRPQHQPTASNQPLALARLAMD